MRGPTQHTCMALYYQYCRIPSNHAWLSFSGAACGSYIYLHATRHQNAHTHKDLNFRVWQSDTVCEGLDGRTLTRNACLRSDLLLSRTTYMYVLERPRTHTTRTYNKIQLLQTWSPLGFSLAHAVLFKVACGSYINVTLAELT